MKNGTPASTRDVILDSINEGVFTVDLDWRITSFNRAAERIVGVKRQEALGRPCCEVLRASVCEGACVLRRTLSTGKPTINVAVHIISAAGRRIPIRVSTALLQNARGRVIGGVETFQDLSQIEELRKEIEAGYTVADIVGRSAAMQELFRTLPLVADSDSTVLIEGPSGTGKELVARALHSLSPRRRKPFVAVNCGALPDTLLESELFGYKAGAFTDARRDKPGLFATAEGGTLFLDEIGDVSPAMQVRLLRVLQDRTYQPLGGTVPVRGNVRVVTATNKDLSRMVRNGEFREDLSYRIRVVRLRLPPLRERREDIPLLIEHFVARFNRLQGKDVAGVDEKVLATLMEHEFPGNVRELENVIEHAFVLCRTGLIRLQHLPPELRGNTPDTAAHLSAGTSLQAVEQAVIQSTLTRHGGNRRASARELGIDPSTLYRKLKAMGGTEPS
ncbi:MAG: Fis family transcriptional regulator [Lentisphaerae bacterium RIFOXYB12_FULL_65_16]|nr:MAG: Fis family transcriptional regulator [Lentisphaerae bacterium RIFOXYA12_64_32]OGV87437.1 MAG: Fis family transcriptional regulator [Lentisphaerae bacterium RIFOXYB12_FULL_65_16]